MGTAFRPDVRQHAEAVPTAAGDKWPMDDGFIRIHRAPHELRRTVDEHGNVRDGVVQSERRGIDADQALRETLHGQNPLAPGRAVTFKQLPVYLLASESVRDHLLP